MPVGVCLQQLLHDLERAWRKDRRNAEVIESKVVVVEAAAGLSLNISDTMADAPPLPDTSSNMKNMDPSLPGCQWSLGPLPGGI
jgi:hypothetical protein